MFHSPRIYYLSVFKYSMKFTLFSRAVVVGLPRSSLAPIEEIFQFCFLFHQPSSFGRRLRILPYRPKRFLVIPNRKQDDGCGQLPIRRTVIRAALIGPDNFQMRDTFHQLTPSSPPPTSASSCAAKSSAAYLSSSAMMFSSA